MPPIPIPHAEGIPGPAPGTAPQLTPGLSAGPFNTLKNANDPQIAAGHQYLVVTAYNQVGVYDKAGNVLGPKPGGTFKNPMWTSELFFPLFDPAVENINTFINLPEGKSCDPKVNPWTQDPKLKPSVKYCLKDVYDTRVTYDAQRQRFWVLSAVRNVGLNPSDPTDRASRRNKIVLAVSKTGDPRDGFHLFWWNGIIDDGICNSSDPTQACPGSIYHPGDAFDYPAIAVTDKYFIQTIYAGHAKEGRAYAFIQVFDADSLAAGQQDGRHWAYWNIQGPDGNILQGTPQPAVQHGASQNGLSLLTLAYTDSKTKKPAVLVLGFLPPEGTDDPPLKLVRIPLSHPYGGASDAVTPDPKVKLNLANLGSIHMKAVYRDGKLYVANQDCGPWVKDSCLTAVRLIRKDIAGFMRLPDETSLPEIDRTFGLRTVTDSQDALVYYGNPGVEVNKNGDMVAVYMRSGETVIPEARYSVYYHNEPDIRPSAILHEGELSISGNIDTAGSSVDPADDTAVWVAHYWAQATPQAGYIAIGKVVP